MERLISALARREQYPAERGVLCDVEKVKCAKMGGTVVDLWSSLWISRARPDCQAFVSKTGSVRQQMATKEDRRMEDRSDGVFGTPSWFKWRCSTHQRDDDDDVRRSVALRL